MLFLIRTRSFIDVCYCFTEVYLVFERSVSSCSEKPESSLLLWLDIDHPHQVFRDKNFCYSVIESPLTVPCICSFNVFSF